MSIKLTFLFVFLILGFFSKAKIPFEQCTYVNKDFTNRILEESAWNKKSTPEKKLALSNTETEACETCIVNANLNKDNYYKKFTSFVNVIDSKDSIKVIDDSSKIHPVCFYASSLRATGRWGKNSNKFYYFCNSAHDKRNRTLYKVTDLKGNKHDRWARKPCLSEDYVNMTADRFHYMANCMGFKNYQDKLQLFSLYNHESQFILNSRSKTGAKCYGQLTTGAFKDVGKAVLGQHSANHKLYQQALKTCPDLKNRIILPKKQEVRKKNPNIACRLTQHADTCFFHSMLFIKIYQGHLDSELKKIRKDFPKNSKLLNEKVKKEFYLPINANEVLRVSYPILIKGKPVIENGEKKRASFILKDGVEVSELLARNQNYEEKDWKIEKLNLYQNNDKIKWYVLHSSYNGGNSVPLTFLPNFLSQIKESVKYPCGHAKTNPKYCDHRKRLEAGKPLDYEKVIKDFRKFLLNNYKGSSTRKKEVANFYGKIKTDLNYLESSKNVSPPTHYKRLSQRNNNLHKEENRLDDQTIEANAQKIEQEIAKECKDLTEGNNL